MTKLTCVLGLLALSVLAAAPALATQLQMDASGRSVKGAGKAGKNGYIPMNTQKSGSGVSLAYRIDGVPSVGSPLTIMIQVSSTSDAQVLLRAPQGLTLTTPDQVLQSYAGQVTEHSVTVVPDVQGRHYLSLFSIANGRPSATSIPVQVGRGTVALKPGGAVQVTPSGERIISVPLK
jgi:hypothetical protein